MNQQKIGEYIAKKRKEHNMTQIIGRKAWGLK